MNAPFRPTSPYDAIPAELRDRKQWLCWREETRVDANGISTKTKVPYNPFTNVRASVTAPNTWNTFSDCVDRAASYDGIGFVITADDPFVCVDLDNKTGDTKRDEEIKQVIDYCDSYAEHSPSGHGAHIWLSVGARPKFFTGRRGCGLEIYASERYITFTGNVMHKPGAIEVRDEQLDAILKYMYAYAENRLVR